MRRLSQVDHPNLAHLYDIEIGDENLTLVMECASGHSLLQIVQESGPLDAWVAARYCRQVADAMDHAHRLRLAHGQLKPELVYISDQQTIKIAGLAVSLGEPTGLESAKFDVAADVAALGQVLTFCLAGDGSSSGGQSITEQVAEGGEESLELLRIARRAELRDGENVISTAKEFKYALDTWIQRHSSARAIPWDAGASQGATHHRDSSQVSATEPGVGRRKLPLILGGTGMLLLLMMGLAYFDASRPKEERSTGTDRKDKQPPAVSAKPFSKNRASSNKLPSLAEASVFHREELPDPKEPPERPDEQKLEVASGAVTPSAIENTTDQKDAWDQQSLTSTPDDGPETFEPRNEPVVDSPLQLLPEAVTLPNVLHDTQLALGPLTVANPDGLVVNLLGGDMASGSGQAFQLVQEPDAANWTVRFTTTRPSDEPSLAIAEIWTGESQLLFRWLAQAKAERACNELRNCVIELQCCGHRHTIRLRQPEVIEPLPVKLERNVRRVSVDWAPDPRRLLFQLVASTGDPTVSESVVPASSGEIMIGAGHAEPGVWIKLTVKFRRKLEVTAVPLIRVESGKGIRPLTQEVLEQSVKNAQNQIVRLGRQLGQARNKTQKAVVKAEIGRYEASLQQFERLAEASRAIHDQPIHFRLFHQVGPHQVELLRTSD